MSHAPADLETKSVAGDTLLTHDESALAFERRIPMAFVGAVLIQTFGALIWAGSTSARITQLESQAIRVQELAERAARVEEQTRAIETSLERIETKIDALTLPAVKR